MLIVCVCAERGSIASIELSQEKKPPYCLQQRCSCCVTDVVFFVTILKAQLDIPQASLQVQVVVFTV